MYHHRTSVGPVELAFTDRHGGVGAASGTTLDLALGVDGGVRRLMHDFAPDDALVDLEQVHGAHVVLAEPGAARPRADGVVSARTGVTLMVRAADCVPVVLADPYAGVVGAVHAGRLGVVAQVVPAAVARMRELGATELAAWIGPHVCGSCYEVPAAMQAEVVAEVPAARATTSWGTPSLDLGAGVRAQLERAGATVVDVSACTLESADLFSHRREGAGAGRLAGVVRLSR